ncbi:MAG: alpha-galactosidase [Phycisphaerae bacterium]|nr:alpha-galactosidase [Phycisphaerae bacterium]
MHPSPGPFKYAVALALMACPVACGVTVSTEELKEARQWVAARFGETPQSPLPFSFRYDGKSFKDLVAAGNLSRESRKLDERRSQHMLTWTEPKTGLVVRCVAVEYHDFPTVEWTLYFKNAGTVDTPIIENIKALDAGYGRRGKDEFLLHHAVGSPADGSDYSPLETPLGPNAKKRISAAGGRPTNSDLCYFNVQQGGRGTIIAVGWPGQWAAEFARDGGESLHITIGQELTRFKLLPDEEVRSPLIALQFWTGDYIRSQNVWRQWMIAYNLPRPGGKLPTPLFFGCSSRAYEEMIKADEEKQVMFINRYLEEGLKIDYWWMDAGWYVNQSGWPNVGTWEVDLKRFPRGLRAISDHAHTKGVKILVWFEPERVTPGTWLYEKHPEWLLGKDGEQKLLNLGNPDACKWLTNHIDKLLTNQGIDLYRQDFNIDPLGYWRRNDAPDRQGITEIKHVTGYLAYWDGLRKRHPDMLIDSCASGGRRNDLETLRRAVPLWRSDHPFVPNSQQSMTYGLSLWIPYHGTGTVACENVGYYGGGFTPVEPYTFWSNVVPGLGCGIDLRVKEIDYAALRKLLDQWRTISAYYYGDFYPLTSCNRHSGSWMAWQFDMPEKGEGMIQVFRRKESMFRGADFKLGGLDPAKDYALTNLDTDKSSVFKGRDLMEAGLPVDIAERPGAVVLVYKVAQ